MLCVGKAVDGWTRVQETPGPADSENHSTLVEEIVIDSEGVKVGGKVLEVLEGCFEWHIDRVFSDGTLDVTLKLCTGRLRVDLDVREPRSKSGVSKAILG